MFEKKPKAMLFFVAFITWMLLSREMSVASICAGALAGVLVSLSGAGLFGRNPRKWLDVRRYFYFLVYILIFLRECLKANIDVALRVIKPNMPINPGIVKVKTRLKSEAALTFLANSITLTPGTLSIDIDSDEGVLYVHWIEVKDKDIVKATDFIVKKFEDIIAKVFE